MDALLVLLLLGVVLATRIPFRTQLLSNWDAVNFAFGMEAFDVRLHYPHPPGYPYFVGLGRAFQIALADANASLVAESILFSALAVATLYLLGALIFDRRTGLIAALLLTFSVTFWSRGEVALAYTSLAFFSSLAALLAYRILRGEKRLAAVLAAVYSVGAGFRPDLLLFLGPLFVASLYRQSPWRVLAALGVAAAGVGLWLVPTVALSGGFDEYAGVISGYLNEDVTNRYSLVQHGAAALAVSARDTAAYTFYALYATSVPLVAGILAWVWRRFAPGFPWGFLVLWVLPVMFFYSLVHIGDPGYVFTFLPGLLLVAARFLAGLRRPGLALVAVLLLANVLVFLFHPRPLTLPGLRQEEAALRARMAYIKENYAPEKVHILSFESGRQVQYYLRQYPSTWIDLRDQARWEEPLAADRDLILFDESLARAWLSPSQREEIALAPNIAIYRVADASGMLVRDGFRLGIR